MWFPSSPWLPSSKLPMSLSFDLYPLHPASSNRSPICSGKPHPEVLLSLTLAFPIMTLKSETSEFIPETVKRKHRESLLLSSLQLPLEQFFFLFDI